MSSCGLCADRGIACNQSPLGDSLSHWEYRARARKHTPSPGAHGSLCARSLNLICKVASSVHVVQFKHTPACSHNTVCCVSMCVLVEQRSPFCQSGQCWKGIKVTSTVDILCCLFPLFIALALFNVLCWDEICAPVVCI